MTDLQTDFDFLPLRVIGKSIDGKNRYDRDSKRKLIEACQKPGASVTGMALKAGVNANQLRKWMSLDRKRHAPDLHGNRHQPVRRHSFLFWTWK
ncbi:transposase [Paraburkholderia sp. Ac-20347]|uniref:transposase n=1 Tax=Paraburkholderia sp. Ac-20347 TaxID=2703892 RepID=UPI001DDA059B|nr:transposase [Paraburkholderia sp. Ac-20347]MBN3814086.1 transposase [Paraburkholderia sp. Ac-20347]